MGNIDVREYLIDLDRKKQLPRNGNGVFVQDDSIIRPNPYRVPMGSMLDSSNKIRRYIFDRTNMFVKEYVERDNIEDGMWRVNALSEMTVSDIFAKLGVNTVKPYPLQLKPKRNGKIPPYATATQDLNRLKGLYVRSGYDYSLEEYDLTRMGCPDENASAFDILLNPNVREECLKYMTPECYDDFINLYLAGTLCTAWDRRNANYFFCKTPNASKQESVISVDNESTLIADSAAQRDMRLRDRVSDVMNWQQASWGPHDSFDMQTQMQRLNEIRRLLHNGKFGPSQERLIKKFLNMDVPGLITNIYNKYGIKTSYFAQKFYDVFSAVAEREQSILSK